METAADSGSRVSTIETPDTKEHHMEPLHIYALLQLENTEEARREWLEQYFVARHHARRVRGQRIRRLRRRLSEAQRPKTVELAVG